MLSPGSFIPIMKPNGPAVEGVNVGGVSPSGYLSRCFSQRVVPAGKPPWRNFCKSRRKIKLSRLQYLSGAEVTDLADEWEVICQDEIVKVASKNCDKFITPTVRVSTSGVNCESCRICHWSRMPILQSSGQKFWFWIGLITIILTGRNCQVKKHKISDVSTSGYTILSWIEIGRRRNLSRYEDVILSNDTIKKSVESWGLLSRYQRFLLSFKIYHDTAGGQFLLYPFVLTARQYGEVVLPDAASGQSPGSLATKLSRCKPACRQAGRVWRTFCRPGTIFIEHYACRGTSLIGATSLSPITNLVAGTGAVSRYKLTRRQ